MMGTDHLWFYTVAFPDERMATFVQHELRKER